MAENDRAQDSKSASFFIVILDKFKVVFRALLTYRASARDVL